MMSPEEQLRRLDTGVQEILEFVKDIDRQPHEICQTLLANLIEVATELRDMRERELGHAEQLPFPEFGKVIVWPSLRSRIVH